MCQKLKKREGKDEAREKKRKRKEKKKKKEKKRGRKLDLCSKVITGFPDSIPSALVKRRSPNTPPKPLSN